MIRLIIGGCVALLLSAAAQAQGDYHERFELAREIMTLSGGEEASEQAMRMVMPAIRPALMVDYPNATPAQLDEAMLLIERTLLGLTPQMADASAEIYADLFTVEELRDLVAFYRTPTGQKLVVQLPSIISQSQVHGDQLAAIAFRDIQPELREILGN